MKSAVSRAGNAFPKIMGWPCWTAHDFQGRTSSADGSSVCTQSRSVQVYMKSPG
jgi:hypothetical protein